MPAQREGGGVQGAQQQREVAAAAPPARSQLTPRRSVTDPRRLTASSRMLHSSEIWPQGAEWSIEEVEVNAVVEEARHAGGVEPRGALPPSTARQDRKRGAAAVVLAKA